MRNFNLFVTFRDIGNGISEVCLCYQSEFSQGSGTTMSVDIKDLLWPYKTLHSCGNNWELRNLKGELEVQRKVTNHFCRGTIVGCLIGASKGIWEARHFKSL